ncbi:hypothetical protein [Arthrobacter sp. YN]|nr:hypothetical protein [Arthrobacter sp. YN]
MNSKAELLVMAAAAIPYFQEQWEKKPNEYTRGRLDSALRTLERIEEMK